MDHRHVVDCIVVQRLRIGTLFKLNLIGNALFHVPLSTLLGLGSMAGIVDSPLLINNQPVTGFAALLVAIGAGIALTLTFTLIGSVGMFVGLLICSVFRPLRVGFLPLAEEQEQPVPPAAVGAP
ncbi:hypothetical protein EV699_12162 [Plasticicumulans lactativorans]|uniref:Uncharacterized protein n=1 Tax=Plasticicumulans lactativorans TaxID=1133106 RepID=A0A4R2L4Q0_9GAMM|nr:hypothetical protein [Plasticicumulans lactativorans]TCO78949.1 hypothetical protein EV699_12162 [Plasticicumulans lactativorans]